MNFALLLAGLEGFSIGALLGGVLLFAVMYCYEVNEKKKEAEKKEE